MNKTIIKIAKLTKWEDIEKALIYFRGYSNRSKSGKRTLGRYKEIFEEIKKYRNRKHKDAKEVIQLSVATDEWDFGDGTEQYYDVSTNKYSLSFRRWREISNIPIEQETLNHYKYAEIIAHFMWEMTWNGWHEEDSIKKAKELAKIGKEIAKDNNLK